MFNKDPFIKFMHMAASARVTHAYTNHATVQFIEN